MKNTFPLILSLFIISNTFGQSINKLSAADSIKLVGRWKEFKKALENKDLKTLKTLSIKVVDCDLFQAPDPNRKVSPYISIDTFAQQFSRDHKLWHVVETKKYHLAVDQFYKTKKGRRIKLFDFWFVVWEPNEFAKGHEGQSDAFEFAKIGDDFKFYGMTSIP